MGIFSRFSTMFAGAPKKEIDAINTALRDVALQSLIAEDKPATVIHDELAFRPNRKQRRDYHHSLRIRDRNTKFSQRSKVLTPKQLHKNANDKWTQTYSNDLLGKLLGRTGLFNVEVSA